MNRILVDTNIVLDLLAGRKPFLKYAAKLFTEADQNKIKLYVSALSIANIHYMLSRLKSEKEARKILNKFKVLVSIVALDKKILDLSLSSEFKDFEDAIQYFSALEINAVSIITRNLQNYKTSKIPVQTAEEYLKSNLNCEW
ncbi:type II toxin-antitoxin system VapC family toxin [Bacteroidota bacterium]